MRRDLFGFGKPEVAPPSSAIDRRIRVQDLDPTTGLGNPDPVAGPFDRRHVANDQNRRGAGFAFAYPGEDRLVSVAFLYPLEAIGLAVQLV